MQPATAGRLCGGRGCQHHAHTAVSVEIGARRAVRLRIERQCRCEPSVEAFCRAQDCRALHPVGAPERACPAVTRAAGRALQPRVRHGLPTTGLALARSLGEPTCQAAEQGGAAARCKMRPRLALRPVPRATAASGSRHRDLQLRDARGCLARSRLCTPDSSPRTLGPPASKDPHGACHARRRLSPAPTSPGLSATMAGGVPPTHARPQCSHGATASTNNRAALRFSPTRAEPPVARQDVSTWYAGRGGLTLHPARRAVEDIRGPCTTSAGGRGPILGRHVERSHQHSSTARSLSGPTYGEDGVLAPTCKCTTPYWRAGRSEIGLRRPASRPTQPAVSCAHALSCRPTLDLDRIDGTQPTIVGQRSVGPITPSCEHARLSVPACILRLLWACLLHRRLPLPADFMFDRVTYPQRGSSATRLPCPPRRLYACARGPDPNAERQEARLLASPRRLNPLHIEQAVVRLPRKHLQRR
eukprot:scaffold2782_cov112-Isochrysis_galbana.AAC.3